jgi:hemerythrin superfamily protein
MTFDPGAPIDAPVWLAENPSTQGGQVLDDDGDVIELLTRDHQALRRLVEELDTEEEVARLRILFQLFVRNLAAHEAGEQQVVFPVYCDAVRAGSIEARRRTDEHEEINELLAEMRSLTPDDVGFEKRAGALSVELDAHFAAEEENVFPQLRASFSPGELMALGDRVRAVATTAPLFPEPVLTQHVHAEHRPKRSR